MPKKPATQTTVLTAKSLARAASTMTSEEERALRMHHGVGVGGNERLARKTTDEAIAAKIAAIELMAFQQMGKQVYGIGAKSTTDEAPMSLTKNPRDKIIQALKRK